MRKLRGGWDAEEVQRPNPINNAPRSVKRRNFLIVRVQMSEGFPQDSKGRTARQACKKRLGGRLEGESWVDCCKHVGRASLFTKRVVRSLHVPQFLIAWPHKKNYHSSRKQCPRQGVPAAELLPTESLSKLCGGCFLCFTAQVRL